MTLNGYVMSHVQLILLCYHKRVCVCVRVRVCAYTYMHAQAHTHSQMKATCVMLFFNRI